MRFEEMLRYIQTFCRKANISGELVVEIYKQKLSQYLKENALSYVTINQLTLLENYCPGFKKTLKNRRYSVEELRKQLMNNRNCLEDKWQELGDKYAKIIRENEMEIGNGLLYGITTLPLSGDEKYDCFKRFLIAQIRKHDSWKSQLKYYLPEWAIEFFNMFFPEYVEQLKNESIPSANEYKKYLQEREEIETEIANVEKQLSEIPDKGRLTSFDLDGVTVYVRYD